MIFLVYTTYVTFLITMHSTIMISRCWITTKANACCGSTRFNAIPMLKTIASPIPKVTSFGCVVITFMILVLSDIFNQLIWNCNYKRIIIAGSFNLSSDNY